MSRMRRDGHPWHPKRVWRVECRRRLNWPRRTKKRLPLRPRPPLTVHPPLHAVWAVDFMSDTLDGGHRFRTVTILDDGVRARLTIAGDTSLPAERVIRVLEQVVSRRGRPLALRLDNGPEPVAERVMSRCAERQIELRDIQPGKPAQPGCSERFNRPYRTEVLNAHVCESFDQVREISAEWVQRDNEARPQDALAGLPPAIDRAQPEARSSPDTVSR